VTQDDCVQNPGSSLSLGRIGDLRSAEFPNFQMKFMKKQHFPRQTHFICLPLRSPAFRDKVTEFNGLLPPTLNPTIIRPTGSLHFTLGVLSLKTQDDIDKAVTFLQSCQAEVCSAVQGQKVTVALRGIDNMHKDVKRTSVIYAVPEEGDGRLRVLSSYFPP
jgi:2'-5' RNA ligase